jgi:hypothetical protein
VPKIIQEKNFYYTERMAYRTHFAAAASMFQRQHRIERKKVKWPKIRGPKAIQERKCLLYII